jgi:peptidoglycan/LPS O-acetylase OafA/YrhL
VQIIIDIGIALVLAALFAWLFHHFVDGPKIKGLKEENKELRAKVAEAKKAAEQGRSFSTFVG